MMMKESMIQSLEAQLVAWNSEMRRLQDNVDKMPDGATKKSFMEAIRDMTSRRDELKQKIKEAREAEESEWEKHRPGIEESWNSLQKSLADTFQRID